jgi:hypothetical protein
VQPTTEIRQGFRGQRRSAIAVSSLLFLYYTAFGPINKIVLLGNTFPIQNPAAVAAVLWLVWGYFTVRMLQYMHDLGDLGFSNWYRKRLHDLVPEIALRKYAAAFDVSEHFDSTYRKPKFEYEGAEVLRARRTHWEIEFAPSVSAQKKDRTGASSVGGIPTTVIVNYQEMRFAKLRAALDVALKTRLATEYALPVLICVSPVVALIYRRLVDCP